MKMSIHSNPLEYILYFLYYLDHQNRDDYLGILYMIQLDQPPEQQYLHVYLYIYWNMFDQLIRQFHLKLFLLYMNYHMN